IEVPLSVPGARRSRFAGHLRESCKRQSLGGEVRQPQCIPVACQMMLWSDASLVSPEAHISDQLGLCPERLFYGSTFTLSSDRGTSGTRRRFSRFRRADRGPPPHRRWSHGIGVGATESACSGRVLPLLRSRNVTERNPEKLA